MEDLYAKYSKDFRKVVDNVFVEEYPELADQLRANVSRFAAYKSNYVKTAFEDNSKAFSGDDLKAANEASKNQFRSWTETELATASARARTAKQFSEFNEPDRKELFPCLKWLPSRAVNPRQSHQDFYDKVWRKDDKFWQKYCPGTEWGCMCDLEECDEEPSHTYPKNYNAETGDVKESEEEKKKNRGIKLDNPYHSGRIFTDEVGYIAKTSKTKAKKFEAKIFDKVVRKEAYSSLHEIQGTAMSLDKNGEKIDVVFDSKTTNHIANDVFVYKDFLMNEVSSNIKQYLNKAKLVAHEPNTKLDKKPSAVQYLYYEYKIGNRTYYYNIEENYVVKENRRFYRLYSITDELRKSAISY